MFLICHKDLLAFYSKVNIRKMHLALLNGFLNVYVTNKRESFGLFNIIAIFVLFWFTSFGTNEHKLFKVSKGVLLVIFLMPRIHFINRNIKVCTSGLSRSYDNKLEVWVPVLRKLILISVSKKSSFYNQLSVSHWF